MGKRLDKLRTEIKRYAVESTNYTKIKEILSIGKQNKSTEKHKVSEKSLHCLQSEFQHQI